jgi:hypothetical protein
MDKTGRDTGKRFYGTAWRGCAALIPTNMTATPTSYGDQKPWVKKEKGGRVTGGGPKSLASTALISTAPARGTLDSMRMGLVNIPTSKSSVSAKLGPGHYPFHVAKNKVKARGGILNDASVPLSECSGHQHGAPRSEHKRRRSLASEGGGRGATRFSAPWAGGYAHVRIGHLGHTCDRSGRGGGWGVSPRQGEFGGSLPAFSLARSVGSGNDSDAL